MVQAVMQRHEGKGSRPEGRGQKAKLNLAFFFYNFSQDMLLSRLGMSVPRVGIDSAGHLQFAMDQ